MDTDQNKQTASHISEDVDGGRQYILHPENNDLFVRTGRQVIEGCRLSISVEVWLDEIKAMFDYLHTWVQEQGLGRIVACYAVPRGIGTRLFFVPRGDSFDFDLADLLARLSIQLMQKFNVGPVEIHQLPWDELDRFVVPEMAVEIYSDAGRAHQTVAS
jgi:hypothetical protein